MHNKELEGNSESTDIRQGQMAYLKILAKLRSSPKIVHISSLAHATPVHQASWKLVQ